MLISLENQVVLRKRLESFLWRVGGQVAALALAFVAENLSLFDLPPLAVVTVGLVISEITKHIRNVQNPES